MSTSPLRQRKLLERPCILLISSFLDFVWGSKDDAANCDQGGHDLLGVVSPGGEGGELCSRPGLRQEWFLKLPEAPGSEGGGVRGIFP